MTADGHERKQLEYSEAALAAAERVRKIYESLPKTPLSDRPDEWLYERWNLGGVLIGLIKDDPDPRAPEAVERLKGQRREIADEIIARWIANVQSEEDPLGSRSNEWLYQTYTAAPELIKMIQDDQDQEAKAAIERIREAQLQILAEITEVRGHAPPNQLVKMKAIEHKMTAPKVGHN